MNYVISATTPSYMLLQFDKFFIFLFSFVVSFLLYFQAFSFIVSLFSRCVSQLCVFVLSSLPLFLLLYCIKQRSHFGPHTFYSIYFLFGNIQQDIPKLLQQLDYKARSCFSNTISWKRRVALFRVLEHIYEDYYDQL